MSAPRRLNLGVVCHCIGVLGDAVASHFRCETALRDRGRSCSGILSFIKTKHRIALAAGLIEEPCCSRLRRLNDADPVCDESTGFDRTVQTNYRAAKKESPEATGPRGAKDISCFRGDRPRRYERDISHPCETSRIYSALSGTKASMP